MDNNQFNEIVELLAEIRDAIICSNEKLQSANDKLSKLIERTPRWRYD